MTKPSVFDELKRYLRWGGEDEAALRAFAPIAAPSFPRIAQRFYERLSEHERARAVFTGPDQIERLKGTLQGWLRLLLTGPWDEAYFQARSRIGRVHVRIGLPQRYMFGAMSLIRSELIALAEQTSFEDMNGRSPVAALHKILDIELAIMLESYADASLENLQQMEHERRADIEQKLVLSEARYDEIVEKAEALITTIDRRGKILLFNGAAARVTGVDKRDAVGLLWLDVFAAEVDRNRVRGLFAAALEGKGGLSYEGQVQMCAATGEAPRRVRWHFTTLPSRAEPALCAIGIDVTNEHDLSVRTRRAERLAALGTMAAGLAHEIRNPLNAAALQLSLARRKLARGAKKELEPIDLAVGVAEGEMQRLAGLVDDFLQFARPQPLRLTLSDLRSVAEGVVELTAPEAAAKRTSLTLLPGPPAPLELDVERIKQVLLNLVRNALEAAGPSGKVVIEVGTSGSSAHLTVQDDGSGFATDAPIFEPFFTTKEHGTGLGLAIVHRIVMDHGGTVSAESRPGRTVFRLSLPIARSAPD